MYKRTCLVFCLISCSWQLASGQFSLSGTGFTGFKLPGSLSQFMSGSTSGAGGALSMNGGLSQMLSTLMNGASSGASPGSPLTQLATAASNQYMQAIRSNPLFSQFTGGSSSGGPPSQGPPQGMYGPPGPSHHHMPPPHSMGHPPMYGGGAGGGHGGMGMHNPMALLSGDHSAPPMYGPPSSHGGYDNPQFSGSNMFPQFAGNENYFGSHGGPYGGPPSYPGPSYGSQLPHPVHHLDRKK